MNQLDYASATRLAIAGLIGLGVGAEREWSGHTRGPDGRFAGIRTFLLLGLVGGCAGLFASQGHDVVSIAMLLGGAALPICAYLVATRRPGASIDGTTEAAALTVLALSTLAGSGSLGLAAGAGSLMVLALSEKTRLHEWVRHIGDVELHAALQFSVLALVVLPLLPAGPLFGALAIKPRALWLIVLLFSALNFGGYLARRIVGVERGYGVTGALGGVISSTAVTLNFSRLSAAQEEISIPLARGVIAACTILVPRVLIISAVLSPRVAIALLPRLMPPFIVGLAIVFLGWRNNHAADANADPESSRSPLRLSSALKMTVAFQIAMSAITVVRNEFGSIGLYGTAAALGFTDVDALTASMSAPSAGLSPELAGRVLALGVLANTFLKLGIAIALGRSRFRQMAGLGLGTLALASGAGLLFG
jgi:uncharacterized membrane protein (DUF4010 family)